jgi:GNAT superfamily N-acetyltransferase
VRNPMASTQIRPVVAADRAWIAALLTDRWGSPEMVSRGRVRDGLQLPGFVAFLPDLPDLPVLPGFKASPHPAGLATYSIEGDECELVSLDSLVERRGVGSALVAAVHESARAAGCWRLWLITTNDNMAAQRFYERRGFRLIETHKGALAVSRLLKPSIPLTGLGGVPLEDELEYELALTPLKPTSGGP